MICRNCLLIALILTIAGTMFPLSQAYPDCSDVAALYDKAVHKKKGLEQKIKLLQQVKEACLDPAVCYELGKAYCQLGMERSLQADDVIWRRARNELKDAVFILLESESLSSTQKKLLGRIHCRLGEIDERTGNIESAKLHYDLAAETLHIPQLEEKRIALTYQAFRKGLTSTDIIRAYKITKRYGATSRVDIPIQFEYDSAALSPRPNPHATMSGTVQAHHLGETLSDPKFSTYRFQLVGHTDTRGAADYNQQLSERRAEAVKQYLVAHFDISPDRIETRGEGKRSPKFQGDSEKVHAINRRVELILFKEGENIP